MALVNKRLVYSVECRMRTSAARQYGRPS